MIRINANEKTFRQTNFWNNIHFHPTDAIEDAWGQAVLDAVAKDGVAKHLRVYAMLEDIVYLDNNGELAYDFTETDNRFDYLVSRGFGLLICMNFIPAAIALDPKCLSKNARYKGKRLCTSTPKDYKLWEDVCNVYVQHLVDRYGLERVKSWYFHCFNEANHMGFWMSTESDWSKRTDEYLKLYDFFAEGIKKVSEEIKIGGPSAGYGYHGIDYPYMSDYRRQADIGFLHKFFRHIREEKNFATGKIGSKIDFYSVHIYGVNKTVPALNPMDSYIIGNDHIEIAKQYGYGDLQVIGDEWEASEEGYLGVKENPNMAYRNTEKFAAHFFSLIDCFIRNKAPYTHLMICLSGQHVATDEEFAGKRTFVTKSGFKTPIYNGYALAAMLGEQHIAFSNDTKVGVIPTMDNEGNVIVALYNFHPSVSRDLGNQHIRYEISLPEGEYELIHYRLDSQNCNTYTAWRMAGSPEALTLKQRNAIQSAEKLKPLFTEDGISGTYVDAMVLPADGVSVLKFVRK